jgi:AcrR family transcriptional regulator
MPRAKGERRLEILKALAQMLEAPKWERITTAALAERLDVSEAALYRHFASKAQMYEGLIEFIESSVFTLANRITEDETDGARQAEKLVEMLLAFAEKNPGMVRVMTGRPRRRAAALRHRLPAPVRQERLRQETDRQLQRPAPLSDDVEHTGQAGSLLMRTLRHSAPLASRSSSLPLSDSPMPASSFNASMAWVAPTIPVSGANTPITEHWTSSTSPSSGNRQA